MGKHLVLVGGGHAHLGILKQLTRFTSRGHKVTLVSPSAFHDYSGLGPGLLSGRYRLSAARFNVARMTTIRGGRFVETAATGIDPDERVLHLADSSSLHYDVISFNCGSEVTLPAPERAIGKTIFPIKPIANIFHARQKIIEAARQNNKPLKLLVIGGGPAGCEITGNLQALVLCEKIDAELTLVTGHSLLNNFDNNVRHRTRALLAQKPLCLLEGVYASHLQMNRAELDDNRLLEFDFAFIASGIKPAGMFNKSILAAGNSGLTVNSYLHSPNYPEIFGGGDCIHFEPLPLKKAGVYAVRQNPILLHNLLATLEQKPLQEFIPQKKILLIFNLGLGRAVATGYGIMWTGIFALWLKSLIDRFFMKKFQEIN